MKRFRFSLEAVQILRQRAENEALERYAAALLNRKRVFERLKELQRELNETRARVRTALTAGCPAGELQRLRSCCQTLEEERDQREAALQAAEVEVNRTLQQMMTARQHREGIDKLRGTQRARYDRALTREEQRSIDELAGRRRGCPETENITEYSAL